MFHFTIWTSGDRDALELIQRIHSTVRRGEIPQAGISAVVCNRIREEDPEADEFLDWSDEQGLPVVGVSSRRLHRAFPNTWREELGRRFRDLLSPYPAALHLLVGYMLWVDDATVAELPLLNLHPALPGGPTGTWQQVIWAIQSQKAREHGATMQWIRPGRENRDRGVPVAFFRFPVTPEMSFDQIRAAGFRREPILLLETLKALAGRDIRLGEGPALDLTETVEKRLTPAVGAGLAPAQGSDPLIALFDLEGPLSPQDNAYEVMGLIPKGHELFAVISRYDDLLALTGKPGYEPGDTLALILPFLAAHDLTAEDVRRVSQRARLVEGARELVAQLQGEGWGIYIISTSYAPHAYRIADELRVPRDHVACTLFPTEGYEGRLDEAARELIHRMKGQILKHSPPTDDEAVQSLLDRFYWEELPATGWGDPLGAMQVMGGRRKAEAAQEFAAQCGVTLADVMAVGDSITDAALLQAVEEAGGLALAFNANTYALPHATAAVASTTLQDLAPLLRAWKEGGRRGVEEACARQPNADWVAGRDVTPEIIERHRTARRAVRGQAALLG